MTHKRMSDTPAVANCLAAHNEHAPWHRRRVLLGLTALSLESRGMMVESMTPERMRAFVAEDVKRWAEWVRLAGITPQ